MITSGNPQTTHFTQDVLGRFVCNGLDEALRSTDRSASRPNGSPQSDARPFDVIIIGGGSFGGALAQHLQRADKTHSHRILVLEAGSFVLPEHVQNLPVLGLNVPGPVENDPHVLREQVWGLPWRSDVRGGFTGLAYCLGGRSAFFGGWSPRLLDAEMPVARWPAAVRDDLKNRYFDESARQIGTDSANDFINGPMHQALREELFQAITGGKVTEAVPFNELPLHLSEAAGTTAGRNRQKLEAPLAVQSNQVSGLFPLNKFSAIPLLITAARTAAFPAHPGHGSGGAGLHPGARPHRPAGAAAGRRSPRRRPVAPGGEPGPAPAARRRSRRRGEAAVALAADRGKDGGRLRGGGGAASSAAARPRLGLQR